MQKLISLFVTFSLGLVTFYAQAQGKAYCSESRRNSHTRQALTTTKEQRLMARYDVRFYKLDFTLERTSTFISGSTLIQAQSKVTALDTFAFELHPALHIDSVVINGQKKIFARQASLTVVRLMPAIANGSTVNARIYYKGTPPLAQSAAIGAGMTSAMSPSWGNQVTWSLSQPFSAYEWFACKQDLTDKADSSEVWVTTSNTNKAGSNGILKRTVTLPNSKVRYEWKSRYPIDYYLISVSVSDYVEYTFFANPIGSPNPVPIQNYVYGNPLALPWFQTDINDTKPLLEKFSELFSVYPFYKEKYGHCMAPFSGGMEHQTMTTQGLFDFTLTAHELAHQWFGDNVTCGSWRDIWLNESFASYSEYLALEKLRAGQEANWMNRVHTEVLSQPDGSVYIPATDSANVGRIFDGRLTYDKGAAVLHMLRFEINSDTLFFRTLKRYQQLYKNSTAKTPDFKQVAETVSGKNLNTFFNQWIYGEGYPTFNLAWNQTGRNFILRSTQVVSMPGITPFFQTAVQYKLLRSIGDTLIRVNQNQPVEFYTIPVRGTITGVQTDPGNWILNGQGAVVKNTSLVSGTNKEAIQPKLLIFPNPATAFIQVFGLNFEPQGFAIFDASGHKVKEGNLTIPAFKIETENLSSGFYILKITGEGKVISSQFQKF
jgi:aminopeptidase N